MLNDENHWAAQKKEIIEDILEYHSFYSGYSPKELLYEEDKLKRVSTSEILNIWKSCFLFLNSKK